MIRFVLIFSAALGLMACLSAAAGLFQCGAGSASCGQEKVESCSKTGCSDEGSPADSSNGCGKKSPGAPASNCCCCGPSCCVYLVPEYRFELSLALPAMFVRNVFDAPTFCPQTVYKAIWHPPAAAV